MHPNSICSGPKVPIWGYFTGKVYTLWVHGPFKIHNYDALNPKP